MLLEAVCGLRAGARSRLSPLGTCAAELAVVVRVADSPNPSAVSPPSAAPDPNAAGARRARHSARYPA